MAITVSDLIRMAGGVGAIARASQRTPYPVTENAVHKWRKNGIPDQHWPLFLSSAGVTVGDIYAANEMVRSKKTSDGSPRDRLSCAA